MKKRNARVPMLQPALRTMDSRTARMAPKQVDPELHVERYREWRTAVMRRAGWRCQALEGGLRCAMRHPVRLYADHIIEREDGGAVYDVANGQCLCARHHGLKTVAERAKRLRST